MNPVAAVDVKHHLRRESQPLYGSHRYHSAHSPPSRQPSALSTQPHRDRHLPELQSIFSQQARHAPNHANTSPPQLAAYQNIPPNPQQPAPPPPPPPPPPPQQHSLTSPPPPPAGPYRAHPRFEDGTAVDIKTPQTPNTPSQSGSAVDSYPRPPYPSAPQSSHPPMHLHQSPHHHHNPPAHDQWRNATDNGPQSASYHGEPGPPRPHVQHDLHISPASYHPPSGYDQHYEQHYGSMIHMGMQPNGQQRPRKAVRASQACENCRAKKSKCDEGQPQCSNCVNSSVKCVYRAMPPPKQERNMNSLIESVSALSMQMDNLRAQLDQPGLAVSSLRGPSTTLDAILQRIDERFQRIEERLETHSGAAGLTHGSVTGTSTTMTVSPPSLNPLQRSQSYPESLQGYDERHPLRLRSEEHPYGSVDGRTAAAYRADVLPKGEADSRQWTRDLHTPMTHTLTRTSGYVAPVNRQYVLNGELSIPLEHSTAAHKILVGWPSIQYLWRGITDANYVFQQECGRGCLRLFGRGEGNDGMHDVARYPHERYPQDRHSQNRHQQDIDGGTPSSTDSHWGTGFHTPGPADMYRINANSMIDQHFLLDEVTVRRLWKSYQNNIHILHPFLSISIVTRRFDTFISRYSPRSSSSALSSSFSNSANDSAGRSVKRKRSNEDLQQAPAANPPVRPEHSLPNALLLLVMALGRICEQRDRWPSPVNEDDLLNADPLKRSSSLHSSPGLSSPVSWDGSAPADVDGTRSAKQPRLNAMSPMSSLSDRRSRPLTNMEKIPGLAYYAYAVNILGEMKGSSDIQYVQACIIASLYMGQLIRVVQSYAWINEAGDAIQAVIKMSGPMCDLPNPVRLAFWTCLQHESDILAELDLPPSGCSRYEEHVPLPDVSTVPTEEQDIFMYYNSQIYLRKELNKAHSALYNSSKEKLRNVGWAALNAGDLARQVQAFRDTLPSQLRWDDDEDPSTDINTARLRGKFYGAWYIIHRPFLQHAIRREWDASRESMGELAGDAQDLPPPPPQSAQHAHPQAQASRSTPDEAATSQPASTEDKQQKDNEDVMNSAEICIAAATRSTVAFDHVAGGRPIITNPFGTAHAQFGNCLVLTATHLSRSHSWLVQRGVLNRLLERTIKLMAEMAPASPTMRTNLRILRNIEGFLKDRDATETNEKQRGSASQSFSHDN